MKALLYTRLVKLRLGHYVFSPGIFVTLITLALLYTMLWMANWQSEKAAYKESMRERIVARKELPAVSLNELPASSDDRLFLPVSISGEFDSQHYFLLDNRTHNNQVGYDLYAVFRADGHPPVLVNRGFIPQGRSRQQLPEITTPSGTVQIKGLLDQPPSKGLILMDNIHSAERWPILLQYVDLNEIQGFIGSEMFAMILRLDGDSPYSYASELPALNLDSAKNTGYAFQWYALSVALSLIYFFVNLKRIK